MNEVNIGKKLQEYRKTRNLSIRELAQQAGVTASLLSQLERNLANPSINTLRAVAKALGVPLFSFFMDVREQSALVVRSENRKRLIFPKNKDFAYELLTPDTDGAIEFLLMALTPGSSSSEQVEGHEGEEVAYVTRGEVLLYLEAEPVRLHQGDSVRIPPLCRHRWHNPTDTPSEVVFAVTPPSF